MAVKVWKEGQHKETEAEKKIRIQMNAQRMALPYEAKVNMAKRRIREWADMCYENGKNYNVHVPEIYGEIVRDPDGTLRTTKAQRTGCSMCGFGIHLDPRPHHFDLLRERNEKEWEFWMYRCCKDENGEPYGWGRVLDWIGVGWENKWDTDMVGQYSIFDEVEA